MGIIGILKYPKIDERSHKIGKVVRAYPPSISLRLLLFFFGRLVYIIRVDGKGGGGMQSI